jgi:Glycosyl transferase family 2
MTTAGPELAVVVLSYRNESTILEAVDSLLDQDQPLEIVVSHSGGGPTPELVASKRPGVRVVSSTERRLPGAARNAGVEATQAPFVAFLAADCRVRQGWASGRLEHHRAGSSAVASALAPADPGLASLAAYVIQHSWRMPHLERPPAPFAVVHWRPPPPVAGVSYARWVLERYGPFLETLRIGEDSALNDRLGDAGIEFDWAPEVVTEHAFPSTVAGMLLDQYRRGRSRGSHQGGPLWRTAFAARAAIEPAIALARARRTGSPVPRSRLPVLAPLVFAAAAAAALGILRAGHPLTPAADRYGAERRRRLAGGQPDPHGARASAPRTAGIQEYLPGRDLVLALYGGPQSPVLGALGRGTPAQAVERLVEQCEPYGVDGLRIVPAFDLIATMATADPGPDGQYRSRLADEEIGEYLDHVRKVKGLLFLEIQPGRARFVDEVRSYERFLCAPDVGVALDPEWSSPAGGVPGRPPGSIEPETVNDVARYLSGLVERHGLPRKLLLVHHFDELMIARKQQLAPQPGVEMILNFDGVGGPRKRRKYRRLAKSRPDLTHGIKLFYEADGTLLRPFEVLELQPRPAVVSYA